MPLFLRLSWNVRHLWKLHQTLVGQQPSQLARMSNPSTGGVNLLSCLITLICLIGIPTNITVSCSFKSSLPPLFKYPPKKRIPISHSAGELSHHRCAGSYRYITICDSGYKYIDIQGERETGIRTCTFYVKVFHTRHRFQYGRDLSCTSRAWSIY